MTRTALLLLQVATASGPTLPDTGHPPTIPRKDCHADTKEIVVCAKDPGAYRLPKVGLSIEAPTPPKAEWRLFGNAKMNVHAEQRGFGGMSAPAAMATVTVPF